MSGADERFVLHPRLEADTRAVMETSEAATPCLIRMMNDRRYPWIVVIPARPGLREWHDIAPSDGIGIWSAISLASKALATWPGVEKVNVGMLGNLVPQLHIHVVGRRSDDPAWPGPVWGRGEPDVLSPEEVDARRGILARLLADARNAVLSTSS